MGAWLTTSERVPDRARQPAYDPAAEVVELCRELIRIDTTNYGDEDGPGERKAAEYVAALLDEVGIEPSSTSPSRGAPSLVARWGGTARATPLLLHGHLDVVPAAAEDWQVDPFSGEIQDGFVWGRGAVDMKDFDAMLLRVVRARARAGALPDRPIVLCFTADEEAGGHKGAEHLVEQHPDEIADCTEAIGEVGGFSATVRGRRIYLIEAAEKGMAWMKLTARGTRRPRLDDQHRQRGHPARRRGRPDRRPPVAGPADPGDGGAARRRSPTSPAPRRRRRTPRRSSRSSAAPRGCSAR